MSDRSVQPGRPGGLLTGLPGGPEREGLPGGPAREGLPGAPDPTSVPRRVRVVTVVSRPYDPPQGFFLSDVKND